MAKKKQTKRAKNRPDLTAEFYKELLRLEKLESKKPTKKSRKKPTKKSRKKPTKKKGTPKPRPSFTPIETITDQPPDENYLTITLLDSYKNVNDVVHMLKNYDWDNVDDLYTKNFLTDRNMFKPPQGIVVVITVIDGANEYHHASVSPYDFLVTKDSIKSFTIQTVREMADNFDAFTASDNNDEDLEDGEEPDGEILVSGDQYGPEQLDPTKIAEITIKFIYGLKAEV